MKRAAVSLLLCFGFSCADRVGPPLPQWVVSLSTDAPVPQFGDRIRVDILDDAGNICPSCSRLLDATAIPVPSSTSSGTQPTTERFPISFGIQASPNATHLRARFFRAATLGVGGEPPPFSTIDTLVKLPIPDDVVDVSVTLPMACFGVEADIANDLSCDPSTGALAAAHLGAVETPLVVGSWPGAVTLPCSGAPPPGAGCVPGGSFLLGDASLAGSTDDSPSPERLVTVSPFFLDVHEMTVNEYLTLREIDPSLPQSLPPAQDLGGVCISASVPSDFPLDCVTKSLASAICAARGMRLPREAEWEFAAGNGTAETRYPWGSDTDICSHASVGVASTKGALTCQMPTGPLPGWPFASRKTDLTIEGGFVDMGGSLSEWVQDTFTAYGTGCFLTDPMLDPVCKSGNGGVIRGGAFNDAPIHAEGVLRREMPPGASSSSVGVRCALSSPAQN